MNRPEASTMPSSHILIHTFNRIRAAKLTVLLVHIVGTRPRVVSKPDTKILDFQWLFLVYLQREKGQ